MQKKIYNAIVLLSGGQDSTTCLYWAIKNFGTNILTISFDYGQRHKKELEQANIIAQKAGVKHVCYDVKNLLAHSSLTDGSDHNKPSYINNELPASFTAGRNLLFLTIAGSAAAQYGVTDIVTGVCQTDYSGYPDCRRNTIDAMQLALSLGLGAGDVVIHTPLMYLTKAQTWKMAGDLGILDIIIHDTLTDYNGCENMNYWGLGALDNPASILRKNGFDEAKKNGWI